MTYEEMIEVGKRIDAGGSLDTSVVVAAEGQIAPEVFDILPELKTVVKVLNVAAQEKGGRAFLIDILTAGLSRLKEADQAPRSGNDKDLKPDAGTVETKRKSVKSGSGTKRHHSGKKDAVSA
jgi:hypothetical protein